MPTIAPRAVTDLRPAADAAATARIDRPPPAAAPVLPLAPASLTQEALVTRNVLEPAAVDGVDASATTVRRVLKPWGVPMLPWEAPSDDPARGEGAGMFGASAADATEGSPDRAQPAGAGCGAAGVGPSG